MKSQNSDQAFITTPILQYTRRHNPSCATRQCATASKPPYSTSPARPAARRSTQVPFAPVWRTIGAPLTAGEKPAVLYFALSADHALDEWPTNEFTNALIARSDAVRVFSATLPHHGESAAENAAAFGEWARIYANGGDVVSHFARNAAQFADELVQRGYARSGQVFVAGLSRGGLIAAHIAMRARSIGALIAFAPVVVLADLPEFGTQISQNDAARRRIERVGLLRDDAIARLADIPVRFYMGNFDRRVGTRNAFELTHALAQRAGLKGVRSPPHEFVMYCSIGKEGHGTPSDVFQDGAKWILEQSKE